MLKLFIKTLSIKAEDHHSFLLCELYSLHIDLLV